MKYSGHIELILGCMFAQKTTTLINRIHKYNVYRKCIIISPSTDNRYSETDVVTHDKISYSSLKCKVLDDTVWDQIAEYDVIGIDEGQFLDNLVTFAERAANSGKIVIISALNSSFTRDNLGEIDLLISKAEKIDKYSAICHYCNNEANFSKLVNNKKIDSNESQIIVGGKDMYHPVCRRCYFDSNS